MQESADAMSAGILAGTNYVIHAAGWLEGGLTFGYEKFAMDVDRCAMLHKQLGGLTVDDEQLAMDAYQEAGPGGNYLSCAHTMRNYATANHESTLADTNSFEQWTDDGALHMQQRANRQWRQMLSDYEPPPINDAVDRELQAFMEHRKNATPDAWY